MKVCVLGLGYIGLPSSVMFASHNCSVTGVDSSKDIVEIINEGQVHIEEPGLKDLLQTCIKNKTFIAKEEPIKSDVFIIAVPTPYINDAFRRCDLQYVETAVRNIIPYLQPDNVVIIESTMAPRSTEDYIKPILEEAGFTIGKNIYLAHCPERVLPGNILNELQYNHRIVGGITKACAQRASNVYSCFVKGDIIKTDAKTAEMAKCIENTYRDLNIAFANEIVKISSELELNCLEVIELANLHPRVNIMKPGPGVGGHCLAIDPYFVYAKAPKQAQLIKLARDINCSMAYFVVDIVKHLLPDIDSKIAALGITYKGNVDDLRESPALIIIQLLKNLGYHVDIHDSHVQRKDCVSFQEAVHNADMCIVLTDHDEYKCLNHKSMKEQMKGDWLFDTRAIVASQEGSGLKIVNFGNFYKYK